MAKSIAKQNKAVKIEKGIQSEIKKEEKDIFNIFNILRKRSFNQNGYTGIVVKNSIYQTSTTLVEKFGGLLFTVILARLLLPELFGLYSLALSTILIFAAFTDLGVGIVLVKFVSNALAKNNKKKAKAYTYYIFKLKLLFIFIIMIALLIASKFIAQDYYNKPIFLALVAGSLYILSMGFIGTVNLVFRAANNFRGPLFSEIVLQSLRLIIVPAMVIFSLKKFASQEINLFVLFLALTMCYFLTLIFLALFANRKIPYLKSEKINLNKEQKKEVNKFIIPISVTILSGVFFGYIDMIMLGRFVSAEYIGYYRAAFSLVGAAGSLLAFSNVLFPVFNRIKGKRLDKALRKSVQLSFLLSISSIIFTLTFAYYLVLIVFGKEYLLSVSLLKILTPLLITFPLISIYTSYLISKNKPGKVAKLLIVSTVLNIILNYVFITWLIQYSQFMAVVGVCIATIISRYFYLFALIIFKK